jgi:hypothetical protein
MLPLLLLLLDWAHLPECWKVNETCLDFKNKERRTSE